MVNQSSHNEQNYSYRERKQLESLTQKNPPIQNIHLIFGNQISTEHLAIQLITARHLEQ